MKSSLIKSPVMTDPATTGRTVDQTVDIAIVGAGIAGSALACALLDTNYRVALIETSTISHQLPPAADSVSGYDLRVSALTHASRFLLEELSVWESITEYRACPYDHMTVWDAEGTGAIEFSAADVQQTALGHIVENRVICAALMQRLRDHRHTAANKVTVMDGVSVEKIHAETVHHLGQDQTTTLLELSDGKTLRCQLLVGADGAGSRVREALKIPLQVRPYGHTALVATVQTEQPHQYTAWQRFLTTGPLAFLPLAAAGPNGQAAHFSSIVWSADTEYARQLMAMDDQDFAAQLAASFEHCLGGIEAVSKRLAFPLYQRHATSYFQSGAVLVADAAHTIHPLAGQGINLGLADVAVLAEELKQAESKGLPAADEGILRRYQRRRKTDTLLMIGAMAGFKHLFGHKALPVRWLRNTGLNKINELQPVKRFFIKQAMGIH